MTGMFDAFGAGAGGQVKSLDSAAERYAKLRLAQAVRRGVIGRMPQAGPGGYAAQWRQVSQNVTAPALKAGYLNPGVWLRGGLPPAALKPGPGPVAASGASPFQPTYGPGPGLGYPNIDPAGAIGPDAAMSFPGQEQIMLEPPGRQSLAPLTPDQLDPRLLEMLRQLLGAHAGGVHGPLPA